MNQQMLMNNILNELDISLDVDEQLFFASSLPKDVSSLFVSLILLIPFILSVCLTIVVSEFFAILFLLTPIFIIVLFKVFERFTSKSIKDGRYLVITSNRIISSNGTYSWSQIHHVFPTDYPDQKSILLKLVPGSIEYESRIANQEFILESDFIYVNSKNTSSRLYNKIYTVWNDQQPDKKLKSIGLILKDAYQLIGTEGKKNIQKYKGIHNKMQVLCFYSQQFPFSRFQVEIELPEAVPAYIRITNDKGLKQLKGGWNNVTINRKEIDLNYRIHASHPDQFKSLITNPETITLMKRIAALGKCNMHFGQKGKKQKELPTSVKDNEGVLDVQMIKQYSDNEKGYLIDDSSKLTIEFKLNKTSQNDIDSIKDLVSMGMELSMLMANGISEFIEY